MRCKKNLETMCAECVKVWIFFCFFCENAKNICKKQRSGLEKHYSCLLCEQLGR